MNNLKLNLFKTSMMKKLLFLSVLAFFGSTKAFSLTPQTITFSAISNKFVNDSSFTLKAVAGSGLTVTYTVVSGASIASVTDSTITLTGLTGSVTIKASQAGDTIFSAAQDVYRSFTVSKLTNAITLALISNKHVNDSSFMVSATATNGAISYSSSNATVATIDSLGLVTILGAGNVTIIASVPPSNNYLAGLASRTFIVSKYTNTITFATIPTKHVTDSSFLVSATATNGMVKFSSSDHNVATIDSLGKVTIIGAGNVTITATVSASANYLSGIATRTFSVLKLTNTVTLGAIPAKQVNDASFMVSAAATNGTIRYSSSNTSLATIDSLGLVTITGAGSVTITASVSASSVYLAGSATRTFTISKLLNTVTLASISAKHVNDSAFLVSASATSGTIKYFSSNTAVARIDTLGLVTIVGDGNVTITASVPASATYLAGSATRSFAVAKLTNTVILALIPIKHVTDSAFSVSATATNGTIKYSSSNTAVATIDSLGTITIIAAGNTTITASVLASSTYLSGLASRVFTVSKLTNFVSVTTMPTKHVTDPAFMVSASATNGTIKYFSSNTRVATIDSLGLITIVGEGNTIIKASVVASATYLAGFAQTILWVNKTNQTIVWSSVGAKLTTDSDFHVTATISSGLTPIVTVLSGPARIDSTGLVHLTGTIGTVILRATQSGNSAYNTVTSYLSFRVNQSISILSLQNMLSSENKVTATFQKFDKTSDFTTGVNDISNNAMGFNLYPNPSHGIVMFDYSEKGHISSIYSVTGQLISKEKYSNQIDNSIDISGLSKGIYFIHFVVNETNFEIVKKIVLE